MATTAPQASTSTSITTAAKKPAKTQTFLDALCTALTIFDDQIATFNGGCETAYKTFVQAYKEAFAGIWPKIEVADIKILLDSVQDTELRKLHRLSELLSPDKEELSRVEEKRDVPTLYSILGNLVNKIPEQKLPDKETCLLISDIFSNLGGSPQILCGSSKGIGRHSNPGFTRTADISSGRCGATDPATCTATWTDLATRCTATTPENIDCDVRPKRIDPVM